MINQIANKWNLDFFKFPKVIPINTRYETENAYPLRNACKLFTFSKDIVGYGSGTVDYKAHQQW